MELNDLQRGEFLVKLRVLFSEAAKIRGEKSKPKEGD